MCKCCEQHLCMSSTFSLALLNETCSLYSVITLNNSGSGAVKLKYFCANVYQISIAVFLFYFYLHFNLKIEKITVLPVLFIY